MESKQLDSLRSHLVELLQGKSAHLDLASVFADVTEEEWAAVHGPHSLWQMIEHIRIVLQDLHDFCLNPAYKERAWPKEYWPDSPVPPEAGAAGKSLRRAQELTDAMIKLAQDKDTDLFARIAWGNGQTILREVLLAADHTSYHMGQAMFLRKELESRS